MAIIECPWKELIRQKHGICSKMNNINSPTHGIVWVCEHQGKFNNSCWCYKTILRGMDSYFHKEDMIPDQIEDQSERVFEQNLPHYMDMLASLLTTIQKAGGSVESFHPERLRRMSVMSLIKALAPNGIRFISIPKKGQTE